MSRKLFPYPFFLQLFGKVSKRKRFIIAASVLSFVLLLSTFFTFDEASYFLILLVAVSYFFTFFSILEGISDNEWFLLFIPPVYFTASFYLFYFFLPPRWLTRLPFITAYGIAIYALLLSQNIFNVGVTKSLQLFRAAFSINYMILTFNSLIVFSLILSFRLNFLLNFICIYAASFPLVLHFLWSVNPKEILDRSLLRYAFLLSLVIAEVGVVFSFTPLSPALFGLLLTGVFYSVCGLFQAYLTERLFKERIREFIIVLVFVLGIVLLSVNW